MGRRAAVLIKSQLKRASCLINSSLCAAVERTEEERQKGKKKMEMSVCVEIKEGQSSGWDASS